MYAYFNVMERGDKSFVDLDSLWFANAAPEGERYVVKTEDYPEQFFTNEHGTVCCTMTHDYLSRPSWRFDAEKYDAGENPFEPFDPDADEWFTHALRRLYIRRIMERTIPVPTELKLLRKTLIGLFDQLARLEIDVQIPAEFADYNRAVENIVSNAAPKNERMFAKIKRDWAEDLSPQSDEG